MKSKRLISAALAAAMAVSGISAIPSFAAENSYNTAYVEAYTASATSKATKTAVNALDDVIKDSGYTTSYTSRYAYKQLTSAEKKFYKQVITAVKNLKYDIAVPEGLSDASAARVYTLVFNEEPELFWMPSSYKIYGGTMFLTYKTSDYDEIVKMQEEINVQVNKLVTKAKKYSTTYNKLKVFYDYLVLNNDFALDEKGYNSTIYNAFAKGESLQCVGYAKAMQYLCDLTGISSMVVTGYNKDGDSHAWNVVYCGNGYYNLDTTWGDPINKFDSSYIQYDYFLVPDSWIKSKTHFNVNKKTLSTGSKITLFTPPSCTKTDYNYFIKSKLNYTTASAAEKALKTQIKTAVKNKKNVIEVRVSKKSIYTTLTNDTYAKSFLKYAKSQSSDVKNISKHLTNTAGTYIVHYDIIYK